MLRSVDACHGRATRARATAIYGSRRLKNDKDVVTQATDVGLRPACYFARPLPDLHGFNYDPDTDINLVEWWSQGCALAAVLSPEESHEGLGCLRSTWVRKPQRASG